MNMQAGRAHHNVWLVVQIEGPVQVARRSDVDMNGHINNVTYIAWTLETVPREVFYNYELQQVHLTASSAGLPIPTLSETACFDECNFCLGYTQSSHACSS